MSETIIDSLTEFWRNYYWDDVGELLHAYPNDQQSIHVELRDLWRFDSDIADDYVTNPEQMGKYLEESLVRVDKPADVDLSGAHVRVTDTEGHLDRLKVGDIRSDDYGDYVAIRGQVGDVTGRMSRIEEAAFECQRCGTMTRVPQPFMTFQQPGECQGCERDGPYQLNHRQSEFIDQRKLKLEQPPEEQAQGAPDSIVGFCLDDLIEVGGENGLQDKAGSRVTVLGSIEIDDSELYGRGPSEPIVDEYFMPEVFIFDEGGEEDIEPETHRTEVESLANRHDAIQHFAENISPGLTVTEQWEMPILMATAYLFGAPRIDADGGGRYRGDLHMLFVSDPGMYKSEFASDVAELSPEGHYAEATDMSSSVGLTSAAVKEGFGDGQFTLKPGALPRANGGHLILDEIDKGPSGFLDGIHGALEGDQMLKVNKAGMKANLATRVGFMSLGNPTEGTFNEYADIADQIDLDPALMSRFDLIATMEDSADEEHDTMVAEGVLDTIDESAKMDHGDYEPSAGDVTHTETDRRTMKAWVMLGRELAPMLTDEAKETLKEFYVDTRDMNGQDSDTVPATARTLVAGWRIAAAFARCELSETIDQSHAERAIEVSKQVVRLNFDPDESEFDANKTTESMSQSQIKSAIADCITDTAKRPESIASQTGISESRVVSEIEQLQHKNPCPLYEEDDGKWKWVA